MDGLRNKKIYIESYGCTYNHADTKRLAAIAEEQGCRQVPPDEAEVFVINTCTVIEPTERTMLRRIRAFRGREIVVTGCMPVVQPDLLRSNGSLRFIYPEEIQARSDRAGAMIAPAIGAVQVGPGCLGACSYCITRFARGRLKSLPVKEICTEVERLAQEGAVEIQLTGQDVSAYGRDIGTDLPSLLWEIGELPGDFCIRVGMMNPATILPILDDLAGAFGQEKVFSFAHIPVQSGSERVLADMRRGYCAGDFIAIVDEFRKQVPGTRISTDYIVGFPTETDSDFEASLALLKRTLPTKVNITRYSRRAGTDSAGLPDCAGGVKKERSRILTAAANKIYEAEYARFIGRTLPVIVTEKKVKGTVVTRDMAYNNIVVGEDLPYGSHHLVRITGHRRHYLLGERIASFSGKT